MAGLDFVRRIMLVENIFCIYRNFHFLKKKLKYLVVAGAVVELILNVVCLYLSVAVLYYTSPLNMDALIIFQFDFLSNMNAILVIVLGLKNAKSFKVLYSMINDICSVFKDCTIFRKSLNQAKNFSLVLTVLFICSYTTMLIVYLRNYVVEKNENPNDFPQAAVLMFSFFTFFEICSEIRFFVEFLSIIVLISILSGCLKCVHVTIRKSMNRLKKRSMETASAHETYELRNNLNKWFWVICNLDKCVFYMRKCFGVQALFSLFTIVIYFIFLMYKGIHTLTVKTMDTIGDQNTIFLLSNYVMVTTSMLFVGQKAQNEADSVRRALAQLSNILVTIPGEGDIVELRKSVKNLHRHVTVERFRNQITSSVFIHMPLIPVIVSAVISHTIILLQFNHVV